MRHNSILIIAALVAASLVAGCSPHRQRPVDALEDLPAAFPSSGEKAPRAEMLERWWESFDDQRLNRLVSEALTGNLGIAQAHERLTQAQATAKAAGAPLWPQVSAAASTGRVRQTGVDRDNVSLSAAAGFELDVWKKLSSRAEAARLDALASGEDLKAVHISVAAELAEQYYLAVERRAQLELTERTIETFRDTLERVERRYREGLVPALDVYQSRQSLAIAMAERPALEAGVTAAQNAVAVLLGRFPGAELTGEGVTLPDAPDFPAGIPSEILTRRPDVEAAILRASANDRRVAAAVADRFPSFSLAGEYGGSSTRLTSVLESPNIFWNVLLQAALPVIDGGRRKAEAERAEASYRETLAGYRRAVLAAFREVDDALARGKAGVERIRMLEQRVSASESALRLALDRYMQGLSDYLPVLTEQQRFFESKGALLAARRQLISDRIALARSLGGNWPAATVKGRMESTETGRGAKR